MIDNEKLNLEIDREWQKCNPVDEGMGVETANIHIEQFDHIARYFAQWGAEHLADDRKITRDVEDVAAEKAREYALSLPGGERTTSVGSTYSESGYYHGFVDGSKFKSDEKSFIENLDEAAEEWAKENYGVNYMEFDFTQDAAFRAMYHFRSGAKWDRQQMLKNAVEGEITKDNRGNNVLLAGFLNNGFEIGDKVRVIIVKED